MNLNKVKTGVYICHCGTNIAGKVDVAAVAEYARSLDNVVLRPPEKKAQWTETIRPNPVLLFRYSALTFNAPRIHYDRNFCREEFGFPGLAVHGPSIATLLIELVRKNLPSARISEYAFRAQGPIFDFQTFTVEGCRESDQVFLWAVNPDGFETMSARAKMEN